MQPQPLFHLLLVIFLRLVYSVNITEAGVLQTSSVLRTAVRSTEQYYVVQQHRPNDLWNNNQ